MSGSSSRGRWQRVIDARSQARVALGKDPNQGDLFDAAPKKKSTAYVPLAQPPAEPSKGGSIYVLTLPEAAARLGLSRPQLETLIAAGKIETLPGQFAPFVPSREVERLRVFRKE